MGLEDKISKLHNFLRKPTKKAAFKASVALFGAFIIAEVLAGIEYKVMEKALNIEYAALGGTNSSLSNFQKARYIQNRPGYKTNKTVEYFFNDP